MTPSPANTFNDALAIGRILQSNSHIDYTAGIYTERDVDNPPDPEDYRFGQPVVITTQANNATHAVIGVIYNTQLVDPDAGGAAPRLASGEIDETFRPSLVDERTTLAGIALLGIADITDTADSTTSQISEGGETQLATVDHSLPPWTLQHNATVRKCPDETFRDFHLVDGELQLAYYSRLTEIAGPFGAELAQNIIERLRTSTDGHDNLLDVIERKAMLQASQDRGVIR